MKTNKKVVYERQTIHPRSLQI